MILRSGREERLPYSLSRWTDVPHAKWVWFLDRLDAGKMEGFDPRTAVPAYWSLRPEDTLGLIFWTKDPENLVRYYDRLKAFSLRVHVTITGWHEEEPGVPSFEDTAAWTRRLAELIGWERIRWRFSPVPLLHPADINLRFAKIMTALWKDDLRHGPREVFLSFLQTNDRIAETRVPEARVGRMRELTKIAAERRMRVLLCNEDRTLLGVEGLPTNLAAGVCAPPEDFDLPGVERSPSEGCGCALAVEPFTINESCTFGCRYCYAADQELSNKKRNTTRHLPVVR